MKSPWREHARKVISKVLAENHGADKKVIAKKLREVYPFGERLHHPYKIWLDEIKVQTKQRRFGKRDNFVPKEQLKLFK